MREIPNTKLLVSLNFMNHEDARMEIFDISKKEKAQKIYTLAKSSGCKFI
mgnify:CR=1 FL=1